jgi:hypothetical protein
VPGKPKFEHVDLRLSSDPPFSYIKEFRSEDDASSLLHLSFELDLISILPVYSDLGACDMTRPRWTLGWVLWMSRNGCLVLSII